MSTTNTLDITGNLPSPWHGLLFKVSFLPRNITQLCSVQMVVLAIPPATPSPENHRSPWKAGLCGLNQQAHPSSDSINETHWYELVAEGIEVMVHPHFPFSLATALLMALSPGKWGKLPERDPLPKCQPSLTDPFLCLYLQARGGNLPKLLLFLEVFPSP